MVEESGAENPRGSRSDMSSEIPAGFDPKEFKKIDPNFLSSKMKNPIVIDTRGILNLDEVKKSNLIFRGLGRGFT